MRINQFSFKDLGFHYIFFMIIIAASLNNSYAQTAFNDPDGLDLSTISEDKFLYFDISHGEFDADSSTASHYINKNVGNCKIYIDEINSSAYALNLFCFSEFDREYPWVKMMVNKDVDNNYTLSIDKFSMNVYPDYFGNNITTWECIEKSKLNEYVTAVNNKTINPTQYINNNIITFRLDFDNIELTLPDDFVLLKIDSGVETEITEFGGIDLIKGNRIYPNILPADCIPQDWTMTYKRVDYINEDLDAPEYERVVKIAFNGNDVYLGDIENGFKNCWLKGQIKDGKIIFPHHQLWFTSGMGGLTYGPDWLKGKRSKLYFVPANLSLKYIKPTNYYISGNIQGISKLMLTVIPLNEDLTFDYDADNNIISNPSSEFEFYGTLENEEWEVDIYDFTSIKIDKCSFSNVYLTKGDTSRVNLISRENETSPAHFEKIYNMQGIELKNNLNNLPSGFYVVKNEEGSRVVRK